MEKSKVYFTNFRTGQETRQEKLTRLIKKAGIENIDFEGKFVAIKIHFGEPGNLAYLRPNYAKTIVDIIKAKGGKPFLTDANTLYVGRRKNALDHIDAAYENGFSPFSTGCHVIIADGLKGTDETAVPVPNGEYVKEAKIGRAVMDADIFISLTHFKAHEGTGFGGTIKNIGMGCGSRAGKSEMHNAGKPSVSHDKCIGCKQCAKQCAHGAISYTKDDNNKNKATIDKNICLGCGRCIGVCPTDAIASDWDESNDVLCKKMTEYAWAVVNGRPQFHISLVMDVSPYCDCHAENDAPIINDVGMFASFDPIALDTACAEAANAQPLLQNTIMEERELNHNDHFCDLHPTTNWKKQLEHGEKIGMGTRDFDLITLK